MEFNQSGLKEVVSKEYAFVESKIQELTSNLEGLRTLLDIKNDDVVSGYKIGEEKPTTEEFKKLGLLLIDEFSDGTYMWQKWEPINEAA